MTLDWGTIRTAKIKGGDFCLYLRCPAPFLQLIETCLTGWQIVEATNPPRLDIIVTKSDAVLKISGRTQTIINHSSDPIDALNYLCLDLAYCCAAQSPNATLLHCAAFGTKGATQIAFGKKGVGKSTLSFHHAYCGDRIFADDLLLWDRSISVIGVVCQVKNILNGDIISPNPTFGVSCNSLPLPFSSNSIHLTSSDRLVKPSLLFNVKCFSITTAPFIYAIMGSLLPIV